jgi:hypothetical protein
MSEDWKKNFCKFFYVRVTDVWNVWYWEPRLDKLGPSGYAPQIPLYLKLTDNNMWGRSVAKPMNKFERRVEHATLMTIDNSHELAEAWDWIIYEDWLIKTPSVRSSVTALRIIIQPDMATCYFYSPLIILFTKLRAGRSGI